MSWTFCKIRLKKFPNMATEWCLQITSEIDLLAYMAATNNSRIHNAVVDFGKVKDNIAHSTNALAHTATLRGEIHGQSFAEALAGLLDEVYVNRIRLLNDGNVLYIKASGGYSFDKDDNLYDVLEEMKKDELHFPEFDVRYIQWPNGTHFYAKIGDVDIEWEGKQKWDTKEDAEKAFKAWQKSRGLRTRAVKMDTWR